MLYMLASCNDGQKMKKLWSGGGHIQQVEQNTIGPRQYSLCFRVEDMIHLNQPLQKRTLNCEGRLQFTEAQRANDFENNLLRDLVDGVKILEDAVETGLVQVIPRKDQVKKLKQFLGEHALVVGH